MRPVLEQRVDCETNRPLIEVPSSAVRVRLQIPERLRALAGGGLRGRGFSSFIMRMSEAA